MTDVLDDASGDSTEAEGDTAAEDSAETTDATPVVLEDVLRPEPASWVERVGAFAVDVLLGAGVVVVFMVTAWSAPSFGWVWWLCILLAALVFFAIAANRLVLPVITGWSLGRSLFGIAVTRRDGRPIDPWFLLLRDLAHLLDTLPLLLGWFWPLVDSERRTFADIVTRSEVCRVAGDRPDYRRVVRAVVGGLGVLALLGAGLGYLAVYRPENAVAQARKEISDQGPKIVPDVLSYSTGTADADFARAQSLVTDGYRPQLVAQQDAIRKAGPIVDNEYWVTNGAVLSATSDHAQMLLLMQGQRGADQKKRFITATVRASFVKSDSGQWQVADLTVLAKPAPPQQAQPAPPPPGKPVTPPQSKPDPGKPASTTAQPAPSSTPKQGR